MTITAHPFPEVDCRNRSLGAQQIFVVSYRLKMFRIYTVANSAQVVNIQTFWIMSGGKLVCYSVSSAQFALELNLAVPLMVLCPVPTEASAIFRGIGK